MWEKLDRAAAFASGLAFYVAVLLLLVLMCIGATDVVLTQFVGRPIPGAVEMSEAAMAVLVFLGLGQVQRGSEHITIDLFTQRLNSTWTIRMRIVTSLLELIFMTALAIAAWAFLLRSIRLSETAIGYFNFPLYPAKALVFVGIVLATIELLRKLIWTIAGAAIPKARGDKA